MMWYAQHLVVLIMSWYDHITMWTYNFLRTKHFHGISSGNQHPYLLKSRYGKVRWSKHLTNSPFLDPRAHSNRNLRFGDNAWCSKMLESGQREGQNNPRILLVNPLQSSRSTLSRGSFLSFLAFKEGMLSTPISVLGGWPTVSARLVNTPGSVP